MFCLGAYVKMDDPVQDMMSLPILDDETISQATEQNNYGYGIYSSSNRLIDNKDVEFVIETISVLVTSLQFPEDWIILSLGEEMEVDDDNNNNVDNEENNNNVDNEENNSEVNEEKEETLNNEGDENKKEEEKSKDNEDNEDNAICIDNELENPDNNSNGTANKDVHDELYYFNPNEPTMHSNRNVSIIKKIIKTLLLENNLWVDGAIKMSVHMCISSKDSFNFFLELFVNEFITAKSSIARNFIKLFVNLLLIIDGKEEWRRREFTNCVVSHLKEFAENRNSRDMIRLLRGYALVFNLTDHVLLPNYTACKTEIASLLTKQGISINFV